MIRYFSTLIILLAAISVGSVTVDTDMTSSIFERSLSFDGPYVEGESSNSDVVQANSHYYLPYSNSINISHRFLNIYYQISSHALAIRAPPIS